MSALDEHVDQQGLFEILTESIDKKLTDKWTGEIKAWEKDHSLEDPYQVVGSGTFIHLACVFCRVGTSC